MYGERVAWVGGGVERSCIHLIDKDFFIFFELSP